MRVYNPDKDESLLVHWWMELKSDPDELEKLFLPHDQTLTQLLWWAKNNVKIALDSDNEGVSMLAWCEPIMSGVYLGAWARKSWRHTKRVVRFISDFYDASLKVWPVLIGITKQSDLHKLHLTLGYEYVGEIPHLYGNAPARIYFMTRENREKAVARHRMFRQPEAN